LPYKDPDERKAQQANYYLANKAEISQYKKRWRLNNSNRVRRKEREYARAHRDQRIRYLRQWRKVRNRDQGLLDSYL
jgi:hypothetical protein